MTKDQIIKKLNEEINDTRSERNGGGSYQERAKLDGRVEGLQYAKSLVMKFDIEEQQEAEQEEKIRFKMDIHGNLTRI